jgi:hypothetical protein
LSCKIKLLFIIFKRVPLLDFEENPSERFEQVIGEVYAQFTTGDAHMTIDDFKRFEEYVGPRSSEPKIVQKIFEQNERPAIEQLSKKSFFARYLRECRRAESEYAAQGADSVWLDFIAHGFREDLRDHPGFLVTAIFCVFYILPGKKKKNF